MARKRRDRDNKKRCIFFANSDEKSEAPRSNEQTAQTRACNQGRNWTPHPHTEKR